MKHLALAVLLILAPLAAQSQDEDIFAGLSQNQVAITANFNGSEILIFGAVGRDAPAPAESELNVIVTVEGPDRPVSVRRMDRRYGIWMNVDSVEFDSAPTFYAVATTGPISEILNAEDDAEHAISIRNAITLHGSETAESDEFTEAIIRIREGDQLYQLHEGTVDLQGDTLFNTSIQLPSNLVEGDYQTRIFLTRDGAVVSEFQTEIAVAKVGLERLIYNLAHERPLIYGILSLVIAIAAGWSASAVFTYIRR